ncbi:hypothetical protein GCM10023319_43150 [Nocardia iowensis]
MPLEGVSGDAAQAGVTGKNSAGGVGVWGEGAASGGEGVHGVSFGNTAGVAGYNESPNGGSGVWGRGAESGGEGVTGYSRTGYAGVGGYNHNPNGGVGVWGEGAKSGGEGVHGVSYGNTAGVAGYNESPSGGSGVWGRGAESGGEGVTGNSRTAHAGVGGYNLSNGPGVWGVGGPHGGEGVHGETHSNHAAIAGYNKGRGDAGYFEGNVTVKGNITVTGDLFLAGADYAEALTCGESGIAAGTVVVVGESGAVHPCRREYDTAVAGIVSGAGGVAPAIVLDRHDESVNIALMGKVWCAADATQSPIRPGDLLTTSTTTGHARRVSDMSRGLGSIIGKALTALDSGQGLVRVLVSPR